MEESILLSICIPTYNRLNYLKKQVSFLINEIKPFEDKVELIISNNCSTDGTIDYLHKLEGKNILINNNSCNIGAANNIEKCIKLASSSLVWVVGDDDTLCPGILEAVMKEIETNNEISWIFINFNKNRNGKDEGKTHKTKYHSSYSGIELLMQIINTDPLSIMFITANILRKDSCLQALKIIGSDTYAIPMAFSIQSALDGTGVMIYESYILSNIDNISWADKSIKIYNEEIPKIISSYRNKISINDYRLLVKKICSLNMGIYAFYKNLINCKKINFNERININMNLRPCFTIVSFVLIPLKSCIFKIFKKFQ